MHGIKMFEKRIINQNNFFAFADCIYAKLNNNR